jgi:hypothetical protein
MQSLTRGVHGNASVRHRTLVASRGAVWLWPGIAMTCRRGDQITALPAETIKFWITRFHGPNALYKECAHFIARSADQLNAGNEGAAQRALDAIGLRYLSLDGAALIGVIAKRCGLARLDIPVRLSPRCWSAGDVSAQASFFEKAFDPSAPLAKFGAFDSLKHPRWPAGSPDSQGGRFAPADSEGAQIVNVQYRGYYHDAFVDYLLDLQRARGSIVIKSVPLITVTGLFCIADALIKPPGEPPYILEAKTGANPTFTLNQALVYPWAVMGNHVTSFNPAVAQLGLAPGLPFPSLNVMVVYTAGPGKPILARIMNPGNIHEFMKYVISSSSSVWATRSLASRLEPSFNADGQNRRPQ